MDIRHTAVYPCDPAWRPALNYVGVRFALGLMWLTLIVAETILPIPALVIWR